MSNQYTIGLDYGTNGNLHGVMKKLVEIGSSVRK